MSTTGDNIHNNDNILKKEKHAQHELHCRFHIIIWNSLPHTISQSVSAASQTATLRLKIVLASASFSRPHLKWNCDWSVCPCSDAKIHSSTFRGTHDSWPLTGSHVWLENMFSGRWTFHDWSELNSRLMQMEENVLNVLCPMNWNGFLGIITVLLIVPNFFWFKSVSDSSIAAPSLFQSPVLHPVLQYPLKCQIWRPCKSTSTISFFYQPFLV